MRIIADLHIHSKYSRATSQRMDIQSIAHYSQIKGLNLLGTGDFTHPFWMKNLKNVLIEEPNKNLYSLGEHKNQAFFMLTTEVCTIFEFQKKIRRIHHVIFTPNLELAEQINDALRTRGNLNNDGRPTLTMSASELVEEVISISKANIVIPAHIWTPWYSLFGSKSGFNNLSDCYQDMTKHIFALETGLSSDPPMNWRLSALDKYTLISNSDSHSPYPYRLGREANVFEVEEVTYENIIDAIRSKDSTHFKYTIETNPAYGRYHWTGHRHCNISVSPKGSTELFGQCPICHKPLTKGVDERVNELADRLPGFQPKEAINYFHLIPLQEIIGAVLGKNSSSAIVWNMYNSLISQFGNEFSILLDVPQEELEKSIEQRIVAAIIQVRRDKINVVPGYDGVYGQLMFYPDKVQFSKKGDRNDCEQTNLDRYL
jgi:uncharacterized protein (TIGR00375 family)